MKAFGTRSAALTLALVGIASASSVAAQEGRLAPRNECTTTPSLAQLDSGLREAARTRDTEALLALVSEDILLDFGGGSGKAELTTRLTSPDYMLWDRLDEVLKLGCGLSTSVGGDKYASWPWFFSKDLGQGDPYETHTVTGTNVRLRSGPSLNSRVLGTVSWDYVFVSAYPEEGERFAQVRTRSGRNGYMAIEYLRSEVDYRLVANPESGTWQVTTFIAGD